MAVRNKSEHADRLEAIRTIWRATEASEESLEEDIEGNLYVSQLEVYDGLIEQLASLGEATVMIDLIRELRDADIQRGCFSHAIFALVLCGQLDLARQWCDRIHDDPLERIYGWLQIVAASKNPEEIERVRMRLSRLSGYSCTKAWVELWRMTGSEDDLAAARQAVNGSLDLFKARDWRLIACETGRAEDWLSALNVYQRGAAQGAIVHELDAAFVDALAHAYVCPSAGLVPIAPIDKRSMRLILDGAPMNFRLEIQRAIKKLGGKL